MYCFLAVLTTVAFVAQRTLRETQGPYKAETETCHIESDHVDVEIKMTYYMHYMYYIL